MSKSEAREAYLAIRRVFCAASDGLTSAGFDALVVSAARPSTPAQWVAGAEAATVPCGRCAGTGRYHKGKGGPCYRCAGKGVQDLDDARRNHAYDRHAIREAV